MHVRTALTCDDCEVRTNFFVYFAFVNLHLSRYFSIVRFFALSLLSQFLCSCKMTIEEILLQVCEITVVLKQ